VLPAVLNNQRLEKEMIVTVTTTQGLDERDAAVIRDALSRAGYSVALVHIDNCIEYQYQDAHVRLKHLPNTAVREGGS
jgi:hypothetical protein